MQIFNDKKFKNPLTKIVAFDNKQVIEAFEKIENFKKEKFFILGYLRYDLYKIFHGEKIKSDVPLLYFEVFKNFQNIEKQKEKEDFFVINKKNEVSQKKYFSAIKKIKKEILKGNTYEVNYTYDWRVITTLKDIDLFKKILKKQKTPYCAFLKNKWDTVLSFSPELFFEIKNNKILTKPMKGTISRGKTKKEDEKKIEFLKNDEKNKAENIMIVDLLRNDLSKVAKTGSVKVKNLFNIETHETVHQMTSEIEAELKENIKIYDIFKALFPCGSITGAPKINTMKIIDKIEQGSRQIYCGAIGLITPEKTTFSVPIRILEKQKNQKDFTCRVGGAIVWDSSPQEEWEETLTKIKFLENSLPKDLQIIETIKIKNKKMLYKKEHLNRMKKTAKLFGINFPKEIYNIKPQKDGILRIILSKKGDFNIEYKPLNLSKTKIVTISSQKIYSNQIFLKYKTNYKPWFQKAYEKIRRNEIYDEIFFNEKEEVTEGARSNILVKINGILYTPPEESGLLAGIMRNKLLKTKKCFEKIIKIKDLKNAEKIYCINSVRGIVEVNVDYNR